MQHLIDAIYWLQTREQIGAGYRCGGRDVKLASMYDIHRAYSGPGSARSDPRWLC